MHAATLGVSKDEFERSLSGCLNKIQFGLASEAQQRIGLRMEGHHKLSVH
jgi:hypothetical protein